MRNWFSTGRTKAEGGSETKEANCHGLWSNPLNEMRGLSVIPREWSASGMTVGIRGPYAKRYGLPRRGVAPPRNDIRFSVSFRGELRIATSSKHKIPCCIFRKRKIPPVSWLLLSPKSLRLFGGPLLWARNDNLISMSFRGGRSPTWESPG